LSPRDRSHFTHYESRITHQQMPVSPTKLLRELIALPSVNPAFLPAGHPHAGEQRVAEFLAAVTAHAGLDVEFQKVFLGRSNLIARLRPQGKARQTILLAPHLDTVNVADEKQFQPTRRAGRIYGRGACDTKGSVAAFVSAICDLAKAKDRPRETEIVFVGLVDEEQAQAGSRAFTRSGFKADLAIVGEPTRCEVVTAHKGSVFVEIETRGLAAHGATPQFGRNAVLMMARVVEFLETDYRKRLLRRKHPVLGCGTVNVGSICGGSQPNIVPDRCGIGVDRRTLPGETERSVCREIAALLRARKLEAKVSSARLAPCLPLETDVKLPLVRQFLQSAGQSRPLGVHYFCDAAVLAAGGIPSVVFGPGDIAQAHTADEWLSLVQLDQAHARLLGFLKSLP
jgi:acetylornithine deacetylase/succinyl-diaminopimelate desuccinylase-like protein